MSSSSRVVGVDVARCLALLGMMATHVLPSFVAGTTDLTLSQQVAGGRASALFAVIAGVSLALLTGGREPLRGRPLLAASGAVAVRAVLVAGIGLALGDADSRVAVILAYYGAMFLLAVPFLSLRSRPLLVLAVVWTVAGPVLAQVVRRQLPSAPVDDPTFSSLSDVPGLLAQIGFTGVYPAVPWMAYLFLGLALGRADLRSRRLPTYLVLFGGGVALLAVVVSDRLTTRSAALRAYGADFASPEDLRARLSEGFFGSTPSDSWWWLAVRAPHSATPFDLAQTMGSAAVVLGACLVLGRLAPRVTAVLFGAGAMTLSLYTAHVLLIADVWDEETWGTYLLHAGSALLLGIVFALLWWRGPLEIAVGFVSGRVRSALSPRLS